MDSLDKSITAIVTNNGTVSFPGAVAGNLGTALVFEVEIDGAKIPVPGVVPPTTNWNINLPEDFDPGETITLILNQIWKPIGLGIGYHNVTVRLTTAINQNQPGNPYINQDANLQRTRQFYFDAPLAFNGPDQSIIHSVYVHQGELIIETEHLTGSLDLDIVGITGQVVKSERLSNHPGTIIRTIDVSSLNSGLYIVSLKNDRGYQYAQKVYIH